MSKTSVSDLQLRYIAMSHRAALGDIKAEISTHIFDGVLAEIITDDQAMEILSVWKREGILEAYRLFLRSSNQSQHEEVHQQND